MHQYYIPPDKKDKTPPTGSGSDSLGFLADPGRFLYPHGYARFNTTYPRTKRTKMTKTPSTR